MCIIGNTIHVYISTIFSESAQEWGYIWAWRCTYCQLWSWSFFLSSIEYCSISNVNSYQFSCKQCCPLAVYAICYSVINPSCGYWTSGTLSALVSYRNTLYNVMVWKDILPVDLPPSGSISAAEINLTVRALSNDVLCCNLAESKSVLKMCISKHYHKLTGFLLWIGTHCIGCVVQQRSSKDWRIYFLWWDMMTVV